jgi:hypothetical protein
MRRLLLLVLTATLSACAGQVPPPAAPVVPAPVATPRTGLIGATASELVGRFGAPQFQVRNGPGLKLQWGSSACILDVYLYPSPSAGGERATHADARRLDGGVTDAAGCAATIPVRG